MFSIMKKTNCTPAIFSVLTKTNGNFESFFHCCMELPLTSILKVARHAGRLTQKTLWSGRKIIPLHTSDICDSLRLVCSHQTVKTNTSQTHARTQLPFASAPLIKTEMADGTSSVLKTQSVAQIML